MAGETMTDADVLHALLDAARRAILPHFRQPSLAIANKAGEAALDPVTEADRAAERAMRGLLARLRPSDGVLGEEYGETGGASGRVWTLDPIDGTRAFVAGLTQWGVLAALSEEGRAVLGGLDQPFTRERFVGADARAAWSRDGAVADLRVRSCAELSEAVLLASDPRMFAAGNERSAFDRVQDAARLTRYGSDCYGYAMLAAGQVDLVVEAGLQPYDIRALIPIIEGAGGRVTDWRGGSAHDGGRVVAAGDPRTHAAALALLNAS